MSFLVLGHDLPDTCPRCPLMLDGWCLCFDDETQPGPVDVDGSRPDWCPLRPLPEKHGRLIDADAIMDEAKQLSGPYTGDGWDNWGVYALIDRQKTIVEAEGE